MSLTKKLLGIGLLLGSFTSIAQKPVLESFPLQAVRLHQNDFQNAQQVDMQYILALNPDRLLAPYRIDAGLPLKAERYGNWENSGLDGHIGGHYLSALALMYASTQNAVLKQRLDYMLAELALCQEKNGDGYVGGIPQGKVFWGRIAKGDIDGSGFGLNNTWVPIYNIHKLFAGLIDAYTVAGNQQALPILVKLSDWMMTTFQKLDYTQIQKILQTEHGGINESFATVYELTQNPKYLTFAQKISHKAILEPLMQSKDNLTGLHANTQIPKVIGFQKIAQLTQQQAWSNAARFFWENVSEKRSVSFGGNSFREHFNPTNDFSPMLESNQGPETCNSYNMLKLSKSLFLSDPQSRYIDFYERTLYNHILSSQHPTKGGFVYFTPIRPRHYRVYSQPQEGFWCCVGSGIENHGKYGEMIYAHNQKDIYVNLFIGSTLTWKAKGLILSQQTNFPYSEASTIQLKLKKPQQFTLYVRYPKWVKDHTLGIHINGKKVVAEKNKEGYIALKQTWHSGDKISIHLPMETTAEPLPDGSSWVSFLHGPIVLAAQTDTTDLKGLFADASRMGHEASGKLYPLDEAPVLVSSDKDFLQKIKPVAQKSLQFTLENTIYPAKYQSLTLIPFYQLHEARYMMYFPVMNASQLATQIEAIKAKEAAKLALAQQTVDYIALGEQQPEADHHFQGSQSEAGNDFGVFWRKTSAWITYQLTNTGKASQFRLYTEGKNEPALEVWLNDTRLNATSVQQNSENNKLEVNYALPENLQKETNLQVKIVAKENKKIPKLFSIRLLK